MQNSGHGWLQQLYRRTDSVHVFDRILEGVSNRTSFVRDRLCIREVLVCKYALFSPPLRASVCDSRHKEPCDERLPVKTGYACRGRIPLVSSARSCGSQNSRPHLFARRTVPRADRYGSRRSVLERRGSRRPSSWFEALADDGNRHKRFHGAHPRAGIPSSNGQTDLAASRLQSYGKLRNPQLCRRCASIPSVRGIAPYVDPRGNPCMNGPRIGISRALLIPLERLYGNPRTGLPCGRPSEENAFPCGEPAQNAQA